MPIFFVLFFSLFLFRWYSSWLDYQLHIPSHQNQLSIIKSSSHQVNHQKKSQEKIWKLNRSICIWITFSCSPSPSPICLAHGSFPSWSSSTWISWNYPSRCKSSATCSSESCMDGNLKKHVTSIVSLVPVPIGFKVNVQGRESFHFTSSSFHINWYDTLNLLNLLDVKVTNQIFQTSHYDEVMMLASLMTFFWVIGFCW